MPYRTLIRRCLHLMNATILPTIGAREENVWKLCERFKSSGLLTDKCYVVFISNTDRTVPLWCQRSAVTTPCVVWDYHVIFLQENGTTVLVYDLDSTIKFPCEIRRYWRKTMRMDIPLEGQYKRCFRVVKAFEFLKYFSSDRRHMRNDQGAFHAPPPHWSPIFDESRGHNLDDFISMDRRVLADISSVYDEDTFQRKFVTNGT
uniref:Protein N-terminal glutamine amidohydrolase n=1 Tax=Ascaris suum TaxID=6253 RepID=F1L648_ASCSU